MNLRLNRDQLQAFLGNDEEAIRVFEELLDVVNTLVAQVADLEERVTALEP